MTEIHWPAQFAPATMPVHVVNRLAIAAPPRAVWAKLIAANEWPSFYRNSSNVSVEGGGELRAGASFRWRTFGINLRSSVEEFVPDERIAWLAVGPGIVAYHAWVITPTLAGCAVLSEETQSGIVARLGKLIFPRGMYAEHQKWLEGLARVSGR